MRTLVRNRLSVLCVTHVNNSVRKLCKWLYELNYIWWTYYGKKNIKTVKYFNEIVPLIKKMNYKTELQGFRQGLHHLRHRVLMFLCFVGFKSSSQNFVSRD